MKILFTNINDFQTIPPPKDIIRADTYISVPLALEMQKRGHDVFFLCPEESTVAVNKIFVPSIKPFNSLFTEEEIFEISNNSNIRHEIIMSLNFNLYLALIESCKKYDFDLVHIHTNNPMAELAMLKRIKPPVALTLHGIPTFPILEGKLAKQFNRPENHFITISDYQKRLYPFLKIEETVYNGISTEDFLFDEKGSDVMLFAGRLKRKKGIVEAIDITLKAGKKMKFAGLISMDDTDRNCFNSEVMPKINNNKNLIKYHGFIPRNKIGAFYGSSKLTLFPIQWEEPFGLVMIESMATGTPTVGFARGSVAEVIKDGETGFIINPSDDDIRGDWIIKKTGIEGMIEAVERIYSMPEAEYSDMRRNCRKHVEENFSIKRMVDEYEEVYEKIINK